MFKDGEQTRRAAHFTGINLVRLMQQAGKWTRCTQMDDLVYKSDRFVSKFASWGVVNQHLTLKLSSEPRAKPVT